MGRICLTDYVLCNNTIYYFDGMDYIPGLINIETGRVAYINHINGYEINRKALGYSLLKNGKIYALQNKGNAVLIYDIERCECNYIDIDCGKNSWGNFAYFCEQDENILIFPRYKKEIIFLNTKDNTLESLQIEGVEPVCGIKIGCQIWLFPQNGNQVLLFEIEAKSCTLLNLEINLKDVVSCSNAQNIIYILNKYGIIYMLNIENGVMQQIITAENEHNDKNTVGKILFVADKLIIFPFADNRIRIIDAKTYEVEVYSDYPNDFIYYEDVYWSKYSGITEDDIYYYLLRKSNYMLKIKKDTADFSWVKIITPDWIEKEETLISYGVVENREENCMDKDRFISFIKDFDNCVSKDEQNKGCRIWEECIRGK